MVWDVFCRVVDNHGDLGVCWRLARDLAARGQPVRLWVDDARALAWMAPGVAEGGIAGLALQPWEAAVTDPPEPGDVVIETFGCDPPAAFVSRMAAAARAPVWINLEYLSAEPYVERCHRLPSPQSAGPGAGLVKHFFYPGFSPATGGLIREPDLAERQRRFDAAGWRAAHGCSLAPGERAVSLFCYEGAPVDALIDRLADRPTLLLACPGPAAAAVRAALGADGRRGALRAIELPWLAQPAYDHLLWSCALNAVRGEDSFVRALWAGRPLLWQIYPQADGADRVKLDAFLRRYRVPSSAGELPPSLDQGLAPLWHAWNGWADADTPDANSAAGAPPALPPLPDLAAWERHAQAWRDALAAQPDLTRQLQGFVEELQRRGEAAG